MSKRWGFALTLFLVAVSTALLGSPVQATTVVEMNLAEMTSLSGAIVHGTVVSTQSRWNDDRSLIYTDVRVQVLDTLKGAAAGEIVITQPGGTVGKLRVDVPGAAAYRPGQELVLFLGDAPQGRYQVAGLSRGRFEVEENTLTGKKQVMGLPEVQSEEAVTPNGAVALSATHTGGPVELKEFLGKVKQFVRFSPSTEGN